MSTLSVVKAALHYLRKEKAAFHEEAARRDVRADAAYQGSITSAQTVISAARRLEQRSNADFIREVMRGHTN